MARLELSLSGEAPGTRPEVRLRADFGGETAEWRGEVVRAEAEIDPRTRMVSLVARVADPYGPRSSRRVPLTAGLFVQAEIFGRRVEEALRIPRTALSGDDRVWVVGADDTLRSRPVDVLQTSADSAWIAAGLEPGDRVSVSRPQGLREGLVVRPVDSPAVARRAVPREPSS